MDGKNSKYWRLNWLRALKPKLILTSFPVCCVETVLNAELTDHLGYEKNDLTQQ